MESIPYFTQVVLTLKYYTDVLYALQLSFQNCLCVLNISGNHMDTLNELSILCEVSHLIATDNLFNDFDDIVHTLRTWRNISRLELTGNPLCHKSKYRDHIIIMSQSLGENILLLSCCTITMVSFIILYPISYYPISVSQT